MISSQGKPNYPQLKGRPFSTMRLKINLETDLVRSRELFPKGNPDGKTWVCFLSTADSKEKEEFLPRYPLQGQARAGFYNSLTLLV